MPECRHSAAGTDAGLRPALGCFQSGAGGRPCRTGGDSVCGKGPGLIAEQRPRLTAGLRALGLRVLDGRANYLLFQAPETLGEALRQRGAVLRSCANYPGLGPGWYRTAVRTGPENEQLLKLLAEVLE